MPLRDVCLWFALPALLLAAGCAHHGRIATTATARSGPTAQPVDVARGKAIYAQQCAACHGAGGMHPIVGPALHGEAHRRSLRDITAIVRDPDPPMPKLYPGTLSARDVRDVSAYVEAL